MARKQTFGCPSMGSTCADFNDTGEPCRYCKQPTVPVFPCGGWDCKGWVLVENGLCTECDYDQP